MSTETRKMIIHNMAEDSVERLKESKDPYDLALKHLAVGDHCVNKEISNAIREFALETPEAGHIRADFALALIHVVACNLVVHCNVTNSDRAEALKHVFCSRLDKAMQNHVLQQELLNAMEKAYDSKDQ